MLTIEDSTVAQVADYPEFPDLLDEYADESAIDGMPHPSARMQTYFHLEKAGALHTIIATKDDRLVGFITILAVALPHYGVTTAVSESFFVAKAHRSTGAGLRLLKAAEDKAREIGAPGLLVSAPCGGDLFKVLPRRGFRETNRVFFKPVQHA